MKRPFLLFFLGFTLLGAALQDVFSLNTSNNRRYGSLESVSRGLLLSDDSDLLPESEAREVIKKIDPAVAKQIVVGRNDWLEKIAKGYGIPALYIRSTNNLDDPAVHPGQQILVQNKKGMMYVARKDVPLEPLLKMYEKLGGKKEEILEMNPLDEILTLRDGKWVLGEGNVLWIPSAKMRFPYLSRPVIWRRISSWFGMRKHPVLGEKRFHDGYDMVAPYGSPVHSGQDGVVVYSGWMGGYGNAIFIRHPRITTRYGHLSKIYVETGQRVKRNQLIGRVGSTGLSTGPHLHFEVRDNNSGRPIRPGKYLY